MIHRCKVFPATRYILLSITTSKSVFTVSGGKPALGFAFACVTQICAASKTLMASTSTLCRRPLGSVTETAHQRSPMRDSIA